MTRRRAEGGEVRSEDDRSRRTRVPFHPQIFFAAETSRTVFSRLWMMDPKPTRGRPPHIPSETDRRLVQMLASEGVPQAEICRVLEVSEKTLRKHFRRELDRGAAKLEAALIVHLLRIAGSRGAVALKAIRFALQSRFGWSEFAPRPPD